MREGNSIRVLVLGAGAIGSYLGGSLVLDGQMVVFFDQPFMVNRLKEKGLRLNLPAGVFSIRSPQVTASLEEALNFFRYDIILLTVKSFDTIAAVEPLLAYKDRLPPILCMQNGVDNEPALEARFGSGNVIAGTLTSAVGKPAPGEITLERLRGVGIADQHPIAPRLVQVMTAAGLKARLYERAADMKWSKLLTNLLANASSAILDMSPSEIFSHPGLYRVEILQLREALAVMDRLGARPVNLPGTPVRLLAIAARHISPAISRPLLSKALGKGRGGKMPSFHIDLYRGAKRSEVSFLNGAVVKHGAQAGLPTPVNQFLTETLESMVRRILPLDTYAHNPDKFLAQALP